jgi:hypothetical protein
MSQVSRTLYACWQRIKNGIDNNVEVGEEKEVNEVSGRAKKGVGKRALIGEEITCWCPNSQ